MFGAALLLTSCAGGSQLMRPPPPVPQDVGLGVLADRFERIVFLSEFRRGESVLMRWQGPVRVHLSGEGAASGREPLLRIVRRLADLSGLGITLVDTEDEANFHVVVDRRERIVRRLEQANVEHQGFVYGATCWGRIVLPGNDPGRITGGFAGVPSDLHPDDIESCLWIEITQALGLPNDVEDLQPSIFSDEGYRITGDLPWYDALLVATLYDSRLAGGMSRNEAAPRVREILADRLARRGGKGS